MAVAWSEWRSRAEMPRTRACNMSVWKTLAFVALLSSYPVSFQRADPLRAVCESACRGRRLLVAVAHRHRQESLRDVKIIPIFHHDDGRNLVPTARHIWDALMEDRPEVEQVGTKTGDEVEVSSVVCEPKPSVWVKTPFMNSTLGISSD